MKNPRNAGSGLLNKKAEDLKPEEIDAMKEMKFFAYDVKTKDKTFKSKTEVFEFLSSVLGFDLPVLKYQARAVRIHVALSDHVSFFVILECVCGAERIYIGFLNDSAIFMVLKY